MAQGVRAAARRHAVLLTILSLVALTLVPYAQVVGFDFVSWDDDRLVYRHPVVGEGLSWEGAKWVFANPISANWTPLSWLSHMLDVELYGENAGGHHLTSLLLHALNTLLLFGLLRSLTGAIGRSALVAALFAVHPLHVESVAWISERRDVLSTAFGLGSLWAYGIWAREGPLAAYLLSALLLGLGLMSKPMLVTLPVLLLLVDYWPLRRTQGLRRLVVEKVPFAAIVLAASAATLWTQGSGAYMPGTSALTLDARAANAVVSTLLYLIQTAWPSGLAAFYPHPNLPGGAEPWTALQTAAAALVLIAVSSAVYRGRRHRYLVTGWLWYLIALVPVMGIVQVGKAGMADRYTYVPLIGIFIALVWAAHEGIALRARAPRAAMLGAILLVVAATVASLSQVATWRDSITLFRHGVSVTEGNYTFHFNLANEYRNSGDVERARTHYGRALEIYPTMGKAQLNLADLLFRNGELDAAIEHYGAVAGHRSLGERGLRGLARAAYARDGSNAVVLALLGKRIAASPDQWALHAAVGNLRAEDGDREGAIAAYRRALEIEPEAGPVRQRLDALLASTPSEP